MTWRAGSTIEQEESVPAPGLAGRGGVPPLGMGLPWRAIARGALVGAAVFAVLAVAYWALAPRTYLARATVAPSARGSMSRLGGSSLSALAGQLGVMPDADATTSPQFYGLLARSSAIQRSMLFATLPASPGTRASRPVWAALGVDTEGCDSLCILRSGMPRLDRAVSVEVDRQTGTFTISAILRDPYEAASLANLYVRALDDFNRRVRQTQSRASREFLERRFEMARGEVRGLEAQLQQFYESNAGFRTAPRLALSEGRLQREIAARTELQATIARQLETARLEEVSSIPLLTVIDSASAPLRKHAPRGLSLLIVALIAGSTVGAAATIARVIRRG